MSMLRNCVSLPHVLCVLHYMTGSDEISHMRAFTKLHCIKTLLKYGVFIFGNDIEVADLLQPENLQSLIGVNVQFIVAVYALKHANCFDQPLEVPYQDSKLNDETSLSAMLENHRRQTWHKTIHTNSTVPTYNAIALRSKRVLHSHQKVCHALTPTLSN